MAWLHHCGVRERSETASTTSMPMLLALRPYLSSLDTRPREELGSRSVGSGESGCTR